ncbi:uncharacterized protein LOC132547436 [Ylistrum balloti]|uniref:uncharacterized protein LOC132547436 n=1 Tax=Ylistrum balloti TaxID=509963 RepID=UPI0029059873|nr:uncharacterized protein LOC132547436 [Ylistrum balloti]
MPRLTNFSLAKHKRAFGYRPDPHRYKIWNAPFILDNKIKAKEDRLSSGRPCTDALKDMLDCYKMHDFKYKGLCDGQIQAFDKCMADFKKSQAESGDAFKSRPKPRAINKLLQKYPQPPVTIKLKY